MSAFGAKQTRKLFKNGRRKTHSRLQPLPQTDLNFIHFQDTNKYTNKFIRFDWMLLDCYRHLVRLFAFNTEQTLVNDCYRPRADIQRTS